MTIKTLPDIVGPAAWAPLVAKGSGTNATNSAPRVRKIWFTAIGAAGSRFGDLNTAAAQGTDIPQNATLAISAADSDIADTIDLSTVGVYVPTGATVTITYGA